jgi:cyanophycinase
MPGDAKSGGAGSRSSPRVRRMDVFLIGGGWSDELAPRLYGGFVEAAARFATARSGRAGDTARATTTPRLLLVLMGTDPESLEYHERFVRTLGLVGGHELVVHRVAEGSPLDPDVLDGVDGLFVGGGPTPEYHASLSPCYARIRELVAAGLPYAGFSAGAAIAASHAVVGGWLLDGRPVCPEDSNEDLGPVTVVEGIGLVAGAVDVHAVQWGTLPRLVAVVEAGLAPSGVALDECTVLGPSGSVGGRGRAWHVAADREGASPTVLRTVTEASPSAASPASSDAGTATRQRADSRTQ